ncbi:hypothetical protein BP6252_04642 [Coleophoma cylindrospora]|uniref:Xylanolytic transcriptional activator regulatory domain-containing protein n=1 Tax=Coleophoma cylindrospora TaxID=1849047 RepID=A0A3D8S1P0_9HELO|nr:hypothetical protein BP6252_04642 [Coleophoma cylindrospora]
MNTQPDEPMERLVFQTSPVSRAQVQALEREIKSLRAFIARLSAAEPSERDDMLSKFDSSLPSEIQFNETSESPASHDNLSLAMRPRAGHLRKLRDGKAAQFYGPTSFFQINPSDEQETFAASEMAQAEIMTPNSESPPELDVDTYSQLAFVITPQSDLCLDLMATFFTRQYYYHMCVYREYFLRDFDAGGGPHYSDLLMYAICAMGALASDGPGRRGLSEMFASRAQQLLYGSALESPNLTTLQALLLLGHRAIGQGKASKGWLFSGMAFRLAHEMGLHLDPSNWKGSQDSRIDREILRRVYWASFIADKQLSLYFGRPPALYPGESDVRNTIRIPYPPEWQSLLEKYIVKGISETAYEDGLALVATWIWQAELSKIQHRMITEVFENRNTNIDPTVLASKVTRIHVSLTKWLADLPSKLHWTKWTVGPVPANIIQLHMVFHTAMIILRRPPRNSLRDPLQVPLEDVQTCYDSLDVIIRLLKIYSRHYKYSHLPLTFVHTLASAASVILMKRYLMSYEWTNPEISKPLDLVLNAIDVVADTWLCAKQIRQVLDVAMKAPAVSSSTKRSPGCFDFMAGAGLMDDLSFDEVEFDLQQPLDEFDLGQLMTDEFMNNEFSWDIDGTFS